MHLPRASLLFCSFLSFAAVAHEDQVPASPITTVSVDRDQTAATKVTNNIHQAIGLRQYVSDHDACGQCDHRYFRSIQRRASHQTVARRQ